MTPERLVHVTDADLQKLSDLCLRSKAHWGYDAAFMAACKDVSQVTHDDLKQPTAVVRFADDFAGMVNVDLNAPKPELSKLFVCPNHMGQGVGSSLINWAKAVAHEAGEEWLQVESDPEAEPFYRRHGALRVGETPSEVIPNRFLPLLKLPTTPT